MTSGDISYNTWIEEAKKEIRRIAPPEDAISRLDLLKLLELSDSPTSRKLLIHLINEGHLKEYQYGRLKYYTLERPHGKYNRAVSKRDGNKMGAKKG